jgi:hypothetical protein
MNRSQILHLIDPFKKKPQLQDKTDEQLTNILTKLRENLYEYEFNDYFFDRSSVMNNLIIREQEVMVKEKELEIKEKELEQLRVRLLTASSPIRDQVRKPDQSYRETLLPSSMPFNNRNYSSNREMSIDSELAEALRISEEEHNKRIERDKLDNEAIERERDEYELLMRQSEDAFKDEKNVVVRTTDGLNLSFFNDKPEGITDEFLISFYSSLKALNFEEARAQINTLPMECSRWIIKLKCGNSTLRQKLQSKDPEAYKCLSRC